MGNILYKGRTTNGDQYSIKNQSMNCSDGHQGGYLYVFETDNKRALLLIFYIMSKMNVLDFLYRLDEKRIVFGIHNHNFVHNRRLKGVSNSNCILMVRFFYKLCRYCRRDSLVEVLERTIDYHRNHNMSIYNAFYMAHFLDKINYYANGMDAVNYDFSYTPNSIISRDAFINAFINAGGSVNCVYYYNISAFSNSDIIKRGEAIKAAHRAKDKESMIQQLNENEELRRYKEPK